MKEFVARAMQMSYLEKEDIKKLHALENKRFYLVPNWNIQQLLNIQSIRDKYGLPGDNESLALHQARIENELKNKFKAQFDGKDESSLDWIHALDWAVYNRSGEIVWQFSSRVGRGSFISQVKASQSLEAID